MLYKILLIGFGGFIGTTSRYIISIIFQEKFNSSFPWATMCINLAGSFIIGVLFTMALKENFLSEAWRDILIIGFCGGFTTFSTFSLDNYNLYNTGQILPLIIYSSISVIGGFLMVFFGIVTAKSL